MHFEFEDLPLADLILVHLNWGWENAITQAQLAKRCATSVRQIQEELEAMKRAGKPICAGWQGVWLSSDASELRRMYRRDRERAIRQLVNNRGRLKAIAALERVHQETIWEAA